MADVARPDAIQAGMHRWVAHVQAYHIDQWADDRQQMLADTEALWHGRLHAQESVGVVPAHLGYIQDFTRIQEDTNTRRAREDMAIPALGHLSYSAWQVARDDERARDLAGSERMQETMEYEDQPSLMDRAREAAGYQNPLPEIGIDTSDPELGATWEAQLAALDARLTDLSRESHHHAQRHGMGY
jgi:hypothetical protein